MHENFFHKLKIYYEDTDSGGVVYYANYLKFLERARTEALFSIGFSNKKIQTNYCSLIIVKSCNSYSASSGIVICSSMSLLSLLFISIWFVIEPQSSAAPTISK